MGSPIAEYIYQNTGIDLIYIIIAVCILSVICLILTIVALCKLKKVYRQYDRFTRGKDAESMEETILTYLDRVDEADRLNAQSREELIDLRKNQKTAFQKMGMVKYDAFLDLSGKLSYVIVLLDQRNSGLLLNSVYTRDSSYSYVKEIKEGKSEIELSREEQEALAQAINKA